MLNRRRSPMRSRSRSPNRNRRNVRNVRNRVRPEDLIQAMIALKVMSEYSKRARGGRNAGRVSRPSVGFSRPASRTAVNRRSRPRSFWQ